MKVINNPGQKVYIKSWCNNPEQGAIDQAVELAKLPFIFKYVALMPDTHQGYGMPIGGVIATEGVVMPNAVGVDIGCGMCAFKTNITTHETNLKKIETVVEKIKKQIPVGFNKRNVMHEYASMPMLPLGEVCQEHYEKASLSLGTLGGGNHFIEIQQDDEGSIWVMVHSGSRNLGKQVCDYYNKKAININKVYYNYTKDLAFLPLSSKEGKNYIIEMKYALKFAETNRRVMVDIIREILFNELGAAMVGEVINIHHNYAAMENHFGSNVLVHRKGATRAREGELGIIPGSQGTASYIVKGLGNKESFMSCSHGAGRKMSRKKAKENLDLFEQIKIMDEQNIIHNIDGIGKLDEAPGAYKDIDIVMEEQKDLVKIIHTLNPVASIKG